MPKIRRWFHVSHDINGDEEVWVLRRTVGEKALSIWLEMLSIADRNNGFLLAQHTTDSALPAAYQAHVRSVAGRCQATVRTVSAVYDFALSHLWLVQDPVLRVRNHAKYRITREDEKIPSGKPIASPPTPTPTPTPTTLRHTTICASEEKPKNTMPGIEPFVSLYNLMKPDECPEIGKVTDARKKTYQKYLAQFPEVSYWEKVFEEMHLSKFLRGLAASKDRTPKARGLDWLCQRGQLDGLENCQKTFEGKYRDPPDVAANGYAYYAANAQYYPDDPTNPLSHDPD